MQASSFKEQFSWHWYNLLRSLCSEQCLASVSAKTEKNSNGRQENNRVGMVTENKGFIFWPNISMNILKNVLIKQLCPQCGKVHVEYVELTLLLFLDRLVAVHLLLFRWVDAI